MRSTLFIIVFTSLSSLLFFKTLNAAITSVKASNTLIASTTTTSNQLRLDRLVNCLSDNNCSSLSKESIDRFINQQ